MDDVFARQAGDVRARPANVPALDDRYPLPLGRERPGEVFARFPAAEDDEVVSNRFPTGIPSLGTGTEVEGYALKNASRSALISSWCVVHMPRGNFS